MLKNLWNLESILNTIKSERGHTIEGGEKKEDYISCLGEPGD